MFLKTLLQQLVNSMILLALLEEISGSCRASTQNPSLKTNLFSFFLSHFVTSIFSTKIYRPRHLLFRVWNTSNQAIPLKAIQDTLHVIHYYRNFHPPPLFLSLSNPRSHHSLIHSSPTPASNQQRLLPQHNQLPHLFSKPISDSS